MHGTHLKLMLIHCTDLITPVVTTSLLAATSITISWILPDQPFLLPLVRRTVSLRRVIRRDQILCPVFAHNIPTITTSDTSRSFNDLEEFSVYEITVTSAFRSLDFLVQRNDTTDMKFTTLSAGICIFHCAACCFIIWCACSPQWKSTQCGC